MQHLRKTRGEGPSPQMARAAIAVANSCPAWVLFLGSWRRRFSRVLAGLPCRQVDTSSLGLSERIASLSDQIAFDQILGPHPFFHGFGFRAISFSGRQFAWATPAICEAMPSRPYKCSEYCVWGAAVMTKVKDNGRRWLWWFLAVVVALQLYFVRELLAAFALFALGFAAIAFVIGGLYMLQKSLEVALSRLADSKHSVINMALGKNRRLPTP